MDTTGHVLGKIAMGAARTDDLCKGLRTVESELRLPARGVEPRLDRVV